MICPTCRSTNQLSTVRITRTNSGQHPKDHFFDEQGQEHHHNPNIVITEYRCSNGHAFAERSSWQCVVCGYKACEAEIVVGEIVGQSEPTAGVRRDPVVPEAIAKKREKERRKR